ncbi:MAG: prephenate dehydratase [Pirellulales bacterium]|nr:prephenate dehydratase [Pirellulales bacterium]
MAKKRTSTKSSKSGATAKPTLATMRKKIDAIDRELVRLMNERAKIAMDVGAIKRAAGKTVYDPPREQEVFRKVIGLSEGPLPDESLRAVFRELISGSRGLEVGLGVAYLGPPYSYSHLAAIERFGQSVEFRPVSNIQSVFQEVESGQADYGLVPVENTTDGRVADTLDMFTVSNVRICAEVQLRIHHNLLANCERGAIREIHSKPQALSQCRKWLSQHVPNAKLREVASTSAAAEAATKRQGVAAVASSTAASHYSLNIVAANIEDNPDNITRFAVLGREPGSRTRNDKTSVMFQTEHRAGALSDALAIFKRARLNLTWIESFPVPGKKGDYLFFVEFEGHESDLRVRRALDSLKKKTVRLEVLGSYAKTEAAD